MTFGLTYILPSNPAEQLAESMGAGHDREVIAKIEEKYGLNKSFGEQYISWLKGALHGDFGMSVKYAQPVSQVLGRKLPNTIKLAVASFILMLLISFPLGILSAVYKDKAADYIIRFMSFLGISLPSFWGGFRIPIEQMEFWQGGEHRLHDRFLYQRENSGWKIDRLAP